MDNKRNKLINYDYALHSDFLIHWTGQDFDDNQWFESDKLETNEDLTEKYFKRLYDILKYGIWMTSDNETPIYFNKLLLNLPSTPKCCFTELKLSESRQHAKMYGRLGIGFKRPFVFKRFGRPVIYYGYNKNDTNDIFLKQCHRELSNKDLINFFKPMNSTPKKNYDLYRESEWRILYFDELKELLKKGLIVDPRDVANTKANNYFKQLNQDDQNKLKYLIPLDKWFSMIIYPSHQVKAKAQNDDTISAFIKEIKIRNGEPPTVENSDWPIELYLDACRNF